MMKAYLAGPDVFRPDACAWAEAARKLCHAAGVKALIPLDNDAYTAAGIYVQNIAMIRAAEVVLANLNPFRGAEPDSGTSFEVGFALALGKRVIGYVAEGGTIAAKVGRWQGCVVQRIDACLRDKDGQQVEDFDLPLNLMLAVPATIVTGGLEEALAVLLSGLA